MIILYFPIKKATQLSFFDRMQLPTQTKLVHEKSGKTHIQKYHVQTEEKEKTQPSVQVKPPNEETETKDKWIVLARHKWVAGAVITESMSNKDDRLRRYTATIRGFRNFKIYEGLPINNLSQIIVDQVKSIRDKIDSGDESVFDKQFQSQYLSPQDDYKQNGTRSKAFKKWFGDWERDPEHSSKVVNEDGEPQETYHLSKVRDAKGKPVTVYHGTAHGGFDEFDKNKQDRDALYGSGFYFTEDKSIAYEYSISDSGGKREIKAVYLNIRNPIDMNQEIEIDEKNEFINAIIKEMPLVNESAKKLFIEQLDKITNYYSKNGKLSYDTIYKSIEKAYGWVLEGGLLYEITSLKPLIISAIKKLGYDGITHIGGRVMGDKEHRVWIAFEPNQIKAVDNQGTFDEGSNNIYKALNRRLIK
jgi:hypothetical protein